MTFLDEFQEKRKEKKLAKAKLLREKNDALRREGKEPLDKVSHLVDTGASGLTQNSIDRQRSLNDLTGEHINSDNLRDENKQPLTEELDKIRRYKQDHED